MKKTAIIGFLGAVYFLLILAAFLINIPASMAASGYIRIDPQYPHSFKYDDEDRYFPMGDTAYYLLGQSQAVIQQYIDSRSAHKFNFIRVGAVGPGFWPFGGTPAAPKYLEINEAVMQKLDWLFDYAKSKGVNIELIMWTYSRAFDNFDFDGGTGMWGNTQYEDNWINTLVSRYKTRTNLFMWTVTNEFERYPNDVYSYASSDVNWARGVAAKIRNIDPIHPIGVLPSTWITNGARSGSPGWATYGSFTQRWPQVVWPLWAGSSVNLNITQNNEGVHRSSWDSGVTYYPVTWQNTFYDIQWTGYGWEFEGAGMEDSIADDWLHGGDKPVINSEFGYQYESGAETSDPSFYTHQTHTQNSIRKKAWKIATAGGFFSAGFSHSAVTFNPSKIGVWRPQHLETLYNFFTTKTEYWKMAPHLELVADYNSCLALPGVEYVAYFPRGGNNTVNLQAGAYSYEWLNPVSGAFSTGSLNAGAGNNSFIAPFSGDAVLHLKRSSSNIDTTAPSVPANLAAAPISSSQINLSWSASTDPLVSGQTTSGVGGYRIYRCQGSGCTPSTPISTSAANSYSDPNLSANTTYVYRVAAYDKASTPNVSAQSSLAGATTSTTLSGSSSGPIGWWKFDETLGTNASDSSGNGNNATLVNFSASAWTTGKINGGLSFDGTDDHVNAGNKAGFNITGNLTLAAWIKPDQVSGFRQIIAKAASGAVADRAYYLRIRDGYAEFAILQSDAAKTVRTAAAYISAPNWHHVAGTYDGSSLKIYINGALNNSSAQSGAVKTTAGSVYIGSLYSTSSEKFDGVIDDARIYNRALTLSEIQALYNAGTGNPPPAAPKGLKVQ